MKKSTAQSSEKAETPSGHQAKPPFWTEVIFTEGGLSLLLIFPMTVLYFLVRAIT